MPVHVSTSSSTNKWLPYLGNAKQSCCMSQTPVTELMSKNGNNFLRLAFLNQGVVDYDVLLPWHTKEVCVTVGASLAAINDIQFMKWELQPVGKSFNASFQITGLKRRKFIEER